MQRKKSIKRRCSAEGPPESKLRLFQLMDETIGNPRQKDSKKKVARMVARVREGI